MKAVVAENLIKIYPNGKKAVDGISFGLEQGEVFGFLGPNGSGKTTVVKLLNGMLSAAGGGCRVFDIDPAVNPVQVHQFSGVVTEHAQMYGNMTGLQNLMFYGKTFGLTAANSSDRAVYLLDKLELTDAKDKKLETYSTGMRQRLSLARAMLHRPKILFLDEPTSGLDPESVASVNNMIKNLAENEGATIFLCTHQLRYAQEICTSYGLISDGVMLAAGTLGELRAMAFPGLTVNIKSDKLPEDISAVKTGADEYELTVNSEAEIPLIIKRIVEENGKIYSVTARRMSLEEIYFALFEKNKEKKGGAIND
ncbi:MAG: ABC transporter ATP-binding protein [Oscillospiraceae bacterium]|nr:ABC transporter ATP-binding protein [Oscillospiraceae bacterium]